MWHYQHFYFDGTYNTMKLENFDRQPLYDIFSHLYHYGYYGVRYFWILSGFVFCVTYLSRPVSGYEFTVRRFARLYPLHLVTLLVVAALQIALLKINGHFSIYPYNNLYHFVINILMIPAWGFQEGYSFNAPIWSVSVELIVYVVFFFMLNPMRRHPVWMVVFLIAFGFLLRDLAKLREIGECFIYFFVGCFIFLSICRFFSLTPTARRGIGSVGVIVAIALAILLARHSAVFSFEQRAAVLSTVLIAGLGVFECVYPIRTGVLDWIGHSSYGVYLWHVPIQLAIILAASLMGASVPMIASKPEFLIAFVASTLAVAWLGFRYLESPAQDLILGRLLKRKVEARA